MDVTAVFLCLWIWIMCPCMWRAISCANTWTDLFSTMPTVLDPCNGTSPAETMQDLHGGNYINSRLCS